MSDGQVLHYEKLTVAKLKELLRSKPIPVVVIVLGSIEQHGEHLPVGTDFLCTFKRAERICSATGSILLAPLQAGYSNKHKGMLGTIFLKAGTVIDIICDILESLAVQGFHRVLIFSGHAGNWPLIKTASMMTQEKYPELNIAVPDGYPQMSADRYRLRFLKNFDYHAGLTETMLVNYEHPELIEKEHIPVNKGELPSNLATIANGDGFDEIDELLAKTLLPSHTTRMTSTGIWGISDVGKYAQVDVKNAMDLFDQFFVRFITKWHSTEEVL